MSIPQGAAWQVFRQRALDAVPAGSILNVGLPVTLRQWQKQGAYTVAATSTRKVHVIAFTTEVGGVMLAEAEHFLDHAAEHQVVVYRQVESQAWTSAAWQIVTVYYWAYFSVLAITRLLGDSIWFIDDAVAKEFTNLAPANSPTVGAGAFRLKCGTLISSTDRELTLIRQKARSHDALWKLWAALVDDVVTSSPPVIGSDEERLFATIRRASAALGNGWPSDLRNLVNYRPGFSYASVRTPKTLSSMRHVQRKPHSFMDLLDSFENRVAALDRRSPIESQADAVAHALGDYTLILHTLARTLHAEIIERSGMDKRWRQSRTIFLEKHGVKSDAGMWPCE